MVYLTTSVTSVLALTVAYIAACATMDSSDGWKPPACIIGYFGTAVSVILAVGSDVYGTRKSDLITTREYDFSNVVGNHSYEVSLPEGNVVACNEFNLSSSVPYDTWVDVKYLNTGVSTLMRHNKTNIELDLAVDDSASANVFNSSTVAKRSDLQYLKRIWVIAKKMEKATNLHATNYRHEFAVKDATKMWNLGRYCQHVYECYSGECSEVISAGWTLNSNKRQFARQSVSGCESS
jgi:hypothetical protein